MTWHIRVMKISTPIAWVVAVVFVVSSVYLGSKACTVLSTEGSFLMLVLRSLMQLSRFFHNPFVTVPKYIPVTRF